MKAIPSPTDLKFHLSSIFGLKKREARDASSGINIIDPEGVLSPSGANNGKPTTVATFFSCLKLLADSVATLPLQVLAKREDGCFIPEDGTDLAFLLTVEPNERQSAFEFWRQTVWQLYLTGNAVIVPMRDDINPRYIHRFILCSPYSANFDQMARVWHISDHAHGIVGDYEEKEVVSLKLPSDDGEVGISIIEYMKTTAGIAMAGDKETQERFSKGGNVRGFFTNSPQAVGGMTKYSDRALKEAAAQKDTFFRAGGRLTYLPGNLQFKELMMSSADMQFLESRKFTVTEICRFFRVPPSLVFSDTSSNYKSAEMSNVAFLNMALNPLLKQIECEMQRKLIGRGGMTRIFKFDRSDIHSCDLETKMKIQKARIESGIDTPNEARLANNRPPVEGGDNVMISANLKGMAALLSEGMKIETENPQDNE